MTRPEPTLADRTARPLHQLLGDAGGETATEYALLCALIAVFVLGSLGAVRDSTTGFFDVMRQTIADARATF